MWAYMGGELYQDGISFPMTFVTFIALIGLVFTAMYLIGKIGNE